MTTILSSDFKISIPKAVCEQRRWRAGQEFAFIPKGAGVLMMPVCELDALREIAAGACKDGNRDRADRY